MSRRRHINEQLKTSFANSGRAAGAGIIYDKYDDDCGGRSYTRRKSSLRTSLHTPEELKQLMNPPVVIVQAARKKKEEDKP
jgi:hypothetical protein